MSSGVGGLIQFDRSGMKKATGSLLILDEPCRGLAPALQTKFALLIADMMLSGGNQVVLSTHSERIMDVCGMFGQIYSVEHKRTFKDRNEFIAAHG